MLFLLISKIEIKKKNLIVTSDDFGVNPSVNDAIINAVNAGKVNSIAVFPNYDGITNKEKKYKNSAGNAKYLLNKTNGNREIGCHLTLISGRPITKAKSMKGKNGYFRGIYEFRRSINLKELREELNAQIKVFTEANIPLTHLSCHHNVLTFFPELYQEYLKVCKDYKLAISSANSHPKKSMNKFLSFLKIKLMDDLKKKDRKEIKKFTKKAPNNFLKTISRVNINLQVFTIVDIMVRYQGPLFKILKRILRDGLKKTSYSK